MLRILATCPRLSTNAWPSPLCACVVLCLAGCGFRAAPYEAQARIQIEVQSPDASTIRSNEVTYLHALAGSMFTDRTQVVHYPGTSVIDVSVFGSDPGVVSNHCHALISRYAGSHRNDIRVVIVEAPSVR